MEVVWVEGEGLTVSAVVLVGEGAGLGTVRLEGTWSLAIAEVEVVRGLGEGLAAPPVGAEVVGSVPVVVERTTAAALAFNGRVGGLATEVSAGAEGARFVVVVSVMPILLLLPLSEQVL